MASGAKTPRRFHPDTREWWIVQDGQIRFSIEGQEPFIASKGYLVQVPYRTVYSLETVGDKPSLRLEVNIAGAQTMYPADETPVPLDGVNFVKVRIEGRGKYDQGNKPYIDFNAVVAGTEKQRRFIADDRAVANIIIGDPKKQRPAARHRQGPFPRGIARILVHPARPDGVQDRVDADFHRRPGRHRVHAQADLASRAVRRLRSWLAAWR